MLHPDKFALFITVSWALIIAPGPDMLYVISRGMTQGRKAGMISALGVICGILVHTTAAAFGLTLIFQTSALAFLVVKYLGAAYLIYLGIKSWREKNIISMHTLSAVNTQRVFWQGVLSNIFNPKIAIFFLAFLPQFVDKSSSQVTLQLIVLGLTFGFLGLIFLLVVGYSSGTIGRWIVHCPQYAQCLGRLSGGILVALGVRLALVERH